jgi:pyruvate dehydrogenase E2 component (dihydrolipoamide acetyltransferase)
MGSIFMEYKLPELGEGISEGTIAKVLIKAGDTVTEGQPLLELETDKAVLEVPSTISGTVENVAVKEGGKAKVGEVIFEYHESNGAAPREEAAPKQESAPAPEEQPAKSTSAAKPASDGITEYQLPELGEGVAEGTIAKVLVNEGDDISEGQAILELETDKAVLEVPSTVSGKIVKINAQAGNKIKVGETVFSYEGTSAAAEPAQVEAEEAEDKSTSQNSDSPMREVAQPETKSVPASAEPSKSTFSPSSSDPVPAAPSTRRLARELGVDIHQVSGSGPGGRISEKDVKRHVKSAMQSGGAITTIGAAAGAPVQAAPLPDFSKWGDIERQELSGIRRATVTQMTRSWTAPHVTQFDKADITDLENFRRNYAKKSGIKITVTALLLKVAVAALKKFPQFNSSLDLNAGELVLKKYFHIGVAVDTDRGLLVPVIRDANTKSVSDLAVELGEAAGRARDRKLSLEEMQGGCFTITNLGGIGGTNFTPIVNTPEVAILGVARGSNEPVWNGKEFQPRFMLPLSLSYDHRAIDGADGARFLRYICEVLENPVLLALEG